MKKENIKPTLVGAFIIIIGLLVGKEVLLDEFGSDIDINGVNSNDLYNLESGEGSVVNRVIDGDTIVVGEKHIRLLGINAPEKGECFYKESKDRLSDLVLNKRVDLEAGVYDTDNFGRFLRYVFLSDNDLFVNDFMLDSGCAEFDRSIKDKTYKERLKVGETQAKDKSIGMWGECFVEKDRENCDIKGNISEDGYGKIYFMPGDPNYKRVQIDYDKGERYFCTEEEAKDAGFRSSQSESQLKYME